MSTLEEKIKIMQAAAEGKAIEARECCAKKWHPDTAPVWNWLTREYRVAEPKKPSINWSHVHPDYKWLAMVPDGYGLLSRGRPVLSGGVYWHSGDALLVANGFSSYTPGDCDWKDSVVQRPC